MEGFDLWLEAVERRVPAALVSQEQWRRLKAIGRHLPARLTSFFGFESRLGTDDAAVDLLLHLAADEGGAEVLAGRREEARLPEALLADDAWRLIAAFAERWAEPSSPLHDRIDHVWLEFDAAVGSGGGLVRLVPTPSLFFGTKDEADGSARGLRAGDASWVVGDALAAASGGPLPEALAGRIDECLAALPASAHVFQVGLMLSRPGGLVRVCVRGIRPGEIAPYLGRLGWAGRLEALGREAAALAEAVDRIDLDLDVLLARGEAAIGPRIGLECEIAKPVFGDERWMAFLGRLVESGLCVRAKREGLFKYPGSRHERESGERFPPHLVAASALLGHSKIGTIVRGVHHVKVVWEEDRLAEAKAYLAVFHAWAEAEWRPRGGGRPPPPVA